MGDKSRGGKNVKKPSKKSIEAKALKAARKAGGTPPASSAH